jgi:hypothetical protein
VKSPNIAKIVDTGPDAVTNLFDVNVITPTYKEPYSKALPSVRVGSFTPPVITQSSTTHNYGPITVKKPGSKIDFERKTTLTFRLDAGYLAYKALKELRDQQCDGEYSKNYLKPFSKESYIEVKAYSEGDTPAITYKMSELWIENLTLKEFNYESSQAQMVTAVIQFNKYKEDIDTIVPKTRASDYYDSGYPRTFSGDLL